MKIEESRSMPPLASTVVFFVFNRPLEAERVFERIRAAKPSRLFVISDGARIEKVGELELVQRSRDVITKIDWPVEVSIDFSEVNLGCKRRITSGLNWVFSQVTSAIILEDDCLPEQEFFWFADALLQHFQQDERIGAISGTNPLEGISKSTSSYFYSNLPSIWGWATWARVWRTYDGDLHDWPRTRNSTLLTNSLKTKKASTYLKYALDRVHNKAVDTWDYQFTYQLLKTGQLSVVPTKNLISNIGFGPNATHTLDSSSALANIPTSKLEFPLVHPIHVRPDEEFERAFQTQYFPAQWRVWVLRFAANLPAPILIALKSAYTRLSSK